MTEMIFTVSAFVFAALTLIATILYQFARCFKKRSLQGKMLSSTMFVLTGICAAVASGSFSAYTLLLVAALIMAFFGDFFLDWKKGKHFYVGVTFFSMCHLLYIYAFVTKVEPDFATYTKQFLIATAVLCIAAVFTVISDKIRFHGREWCMVVYSLILMASFLCAAVRGANMIIDGRNEFGICLLAGAILFIVSDTFLASQLYGQPKVKKPGIFVALTYFPAQALFALSMIYA